MIIATTNFSNIADKMFPSCKSKKEERIKIKSEEHGQDKILSQLLICRINLTDPEEESPPFLCNRSFCLTRKAENGSCKRGPTTGIFPNRSTARASNVSLNATITNTF